MRACAVWAVWWAVGCGPTEIGNVPKGPDPGVDWDGDGWNQLLDCDDLDETVYPGGDEVCGNEVDDDCDPSTPDVWDGDLDGVPCDLDCDDTDPAISPSVTEVPCDAVDNDCSAQTADVEDGDGDGYDGCDPSDAADGDGRPADCDDDDPWSSPANAELECNGRDDDCNPVTLDAIDLDQDGADLCRLSDAGDSDGMPPDCDDSDPLVYPGAYEIKCDGINNDCMDSPDAPDNDGDGADQCEPYDLGDTDGLPADCDDGVAVITPGSLESICDGVDNDCDATTPDAPNADGDLADLCAVGDLGDTDGLDADCDDTDPNAYPGAAEIPCDGVDQDCGVLPDSENLDGDPADNCDPMDASDSDGVAADCDDGDPFVYPDAPEIAIDGVDQDCDGADLTGVFDKDADGVLDVEDLCLGADDALDADADGIPDGCDPVDWFVSTDVGSGGLAWHVDLVDLDGDGDLDLIEANSFGSNGAFLNDGFGGFVPVSSGPGTFVWSMDIAAGDLDGDSTVDVFVANYGETDAVFFNDGTGNFTDSGQMLGYGLSAAVALGDLDGDTDLDAFVVADGANEIWLNDGTGTFVAGPTLGMAIGYGVGLGDLDADGDLDAVVANAGSPNAVWLNDGSANFTEGMQTLGEGQNTDVALGDLDADGDLDAFFSRRDEPSQVYFNTGDGVFVPSPYPEMTDGMSEGVTLGDLDHDGDLDAFVVSQCSVCASTSELLINNGEGVFLLAWEVGPFVKLEADAAIGDVDGDGRMDLVVGTWGVSDLWISQYP